MTDSIRILKGQKARLFAFALAPAAAVLSSAVPVDASAIVPILAFLSVASLAGVAFVWLNAAEAVKASERAASQASSNYVLLANRLIKLEHQLRTPSAGSASRSSITAAPVPDDAGTKDTPRAVRGSEREGKEKKVEPALLPRMSSEDDLRRMRLVTQAFEADQIELHLQPIVALPQRKIRFYEALARLRLADGTLLGPSEFLTFLERLGRAPEFDRRVLERAMAVARHLLARGSEAIVGVNLCSRSIREPGFLWSLVGAMDASPDLLGKVVLELPQESWRELDSDQKAALATLRDRGVPLSVDRAADLQFDARSLADLGVRFLKLPAELMIAAAEEDESHVGADLGVRDFALSLLREGIKLVAEHVEREEMVPGLIDLGVPLAQGFVFSAPRAVKADVLGMPARPASADGQEPVLGRAG